MAHEHISKKAREEFKKKIANKKLKTARSLGLTLLEYKKRFTDKPQRKITKKPLKVPVVKSASHESAKEYHEKRVRKAKLTKKTKKKNRKKLNLPEPKRNIWTIKR